MGDAEEEARRRKRRRLRKGQYLRPRQIHRTPEEAEEAAVSRLLTYDWSLLSPEEQEASLECAQIQGEAWVDEFGGSPAADGISNHEAYRRSAVRHAYHGALVINEVEYELWRSNFEDPRVAAFAVGVALALARRRT